MRKIKTNKYSLEIPPYNAYLTIIFSEDVNYSKNKVCKKLKLFESIEDTAGDAWFMEEDEGRYIIILEYNPDPDVIAHEALHATFAILKRAGVLLSNDNEESFTYVLGFIVQKIYEKLSKIILKSNKSESTDSAERS